MNDSSTKEISITTFCLFSMGLCRCGEIPPARAVICPKAGIGATTVGPASWGWGGCCRLGGGPWSTWDAVGGIAVHFVQTMCLNRFLRVKGKSPSRGLFRLLWKYSRNFIERECCVVEIVRSLKVLSLRPDQSRVVLCCLYGLSFCANFARPSHQPNQLGGICCFSLSMPWPSL